MRHNAGQAVQSAVPPDQLEKLVSAACARVQDETARSAPFLCQAVSEWMAHLSSTGRAPDYFLQPRTFPFLRLPLWAARSFAVEPDPEFLADVTYSTINGYYYIRLLDNLMDGHATVELKILPASAFFLTEFQSTYYKYFPAGHPFWDVFRSAWFSASEAVIREMDLDAIHQAEFEQVTVAKLAGARIPLAAVGWRFGAGERLRPWEEFTLALARWVQMEDDLFDWHLDLRHGKTSYFLTKARQSKGPESVEAWVIREGFLESVDILQRELSALRSLASPLESEEVISYLDLQEMLLEKQKAGILEAFQVLKDVARITETTIAPASGSAPAAKCRDHHAQ